ncbi:CbrC family protein [Streptomyces sp. RK31]|nr:CbrC family protein [Streptomyces sp. RK31]MBQ0974293.1 CbrC family protein [Streptomyces sp. RK31]
MSDGLPSFRHHPDPVATGSIRASTDRCVCCGRVTSATTP